MKIDTKSTCLDCGKEIEYVGPFWRHIGYSPRHMAKPIERKKMAKDTYSEPTPPTPGEAPVPTPPETATSDVPTETVTESEE